MKRLVALLLAIICICSTCTAFAAENSRRAKYIRFIPTEVVAESKKVKVTGYFVNLNDDYEVMNFSDFKMTVRYNNKVIAEGNFGTLKEFTVPPLGMVKRTFTFNERRNIKTGTYICDIDFDCVISCSFEYWE